MIRKPGILVIEISNNFCITINFTDKLKIFGVIMSTIMINIFS